jgi:hypothetical protein
MTIGQRSGRLRCMLVRSPEDNGLAARAPSARARCQTCGRFTSAGQAECRRCLSRRTAIAIDALLPSAGAPDDASAASAEAAAVEPAGSTVDPPTSASTSPTGIAPAPPADPTGAFSVAPAHRTQVAPAADAPAIARPAAGPTAPAAPATPAPFAARTRSQYVVPRPSELHGPSHAVGRRFQARPSTDLRGRSSRGPSVLAADTWTARIARTILRLLTVLVVGAVAIGAAVLALLVLSSLGP